DFTAGHISTEEARQLIAALAPPAESGLELHPGVQYRHALIARGRAEFARLAETRTQPPHDIPDQPIADHLPKGPGAEPLLSLMEGSKAILAEHPVNQARRAAGKRPATQIWLWGQGKRPNLRPFREVYGKKGAILSAVDLVRGVGVLLGWTR